ncbi:MAG TPA: D-alanyl-D-alanine carboxypeptidase/D-alanyl-D-alanine-endopeptidase [Longimicrobiales bacterium]|nr:D-alanyl-D-alanine carboxypeptidase/D-alanyl-D-alanine-endopeptidase [Longimicrobiales bacterium]
MDSVISTPPLHRAHWGVLVTDARTGEVLVDRNADKLFTTASNAKVPTVAAAFELLGPEYRWRTELVARNVREGVAEDLFIRGGGDPTFSRTFHDDALAPMDSLADSLALAGVRRIEGPIVVDVSRFDSILVHPAWEHFDLDWYYAAPVSPFAIHAGAYPVVITPTRIGRPADVEVLLPAGLMGVDARIMTTEGSRGWDDDLRRVAGADSVVLRGTIGVEAEADTSWIAQDQPARLAARTLALALERRGISVKGDIVITTVRSADPAGAAGTDEVRVAWSSPPLTDVAQVALEQSDNWITEQILKTLGAERGEGGSWSQGTAVVEGFLDERVGVETGSHYLRDGSGLSAQTLMTPRAMVELLRYAAGRPWATAFREALVAPGEEEGTLEERLLPHADRLQGKTGTIAHVNALSGYALSITDRPLIFSILSASSGQSARLVRAATDIIVNTMINARN